ncbi:hydroxysteroid dehydrogenase-like protein 1 [Planococcus citri]|uniref:hydroxysteroid dehydrogenase-like protein 1 n=1 Tax=Planococcus citri TaxID=170843 RepID=UPI0031F74360
MGLPPDSASLIMLEIGKELRFYEDTLATIGLLYVGKLSVSFGLSLYRGFKEHILTKLCPNKELIFSYGNWAMVTGATEGMGKAFAEELARRGLNIVLLDTDLSKLNDISAEIEQETGVDTRIVEVDFFDEFVINENLVEVIKSVEIGILINSFQTVIQTPTPFTKISAEEINSLLNANVKSLTMITYVILTGMLHRNKGLILNVSAFSGLYPVPFISVYSASKAYTEFFSQALNMECRGTDVVVQTVTPGFVKTQQTLDESVLSYILPTMNNFVRNTVDSLAVSSRVTGSWRFSLELWLLKRIPECIMQILVYELMSSACR